jgi:hypothetical protein
MVKREERLQREAREKKKEEKRQRKKNEKKGSNIFVSPAISVKKGKKEKTGKEKEKHVCPRLTRA